MVKKIDSGEELTERELRTLVYEYEEVDRDEGENRRWSRTIDSIIELCGRYFCVSWEEGLTEYQEDEFYEQPYEVEKYTYKKTLQLQNGEKLKIIQKQSKVCLKLEVNMVDEKQKYEEIVDDILLLQNIFDDAWKLNNTNQIPLSDYLELSKKCTTYLPLVMQTLSALKDECFLNSN